MTRRGEPTAARMRPIQKRLDRYHEWEQWAEAERYLRNVVKRFPGDHWLINWLADAVYEQRKYRAALRLYRKAEALAPECAMVRWGLAGALAACGDTREAWRLYQSIARRRPEVLGTRECGEGLPWARGLIADCHFRLGQLAERQGAKAAARRRYRTYLRFMERPTPSIESRKAALARLRALSGAPGQAA